MRRIPINQCTKSWMISVLSSKNTRGNTPALTLGWLELSWGIVWSPVEESSYNKKLVAFRDPTNLSSVLLDWEGSTLPSSSFPASESNKSPIPKLSSKLSLAVSWWDEAMNVPNSTEKVEAGSQNFLCRRKELSEIFLPPLQCTWQLHTSMMGCGQLKSSAYREINPIT